MLKGYIKMKKNLTKTYEESHIDASLSLMFAIRSASEECTKKILDNQPLSPMERIKFCLEWKEDILFRNQGRQNFKRILEKGTKNSEVSNPINKPKHEIDPDLKMEFAMMQEKLKNAISDYKLELTNPKKSKDKSDRGMGSY